MVRCLLDLLRLIEGNQRPYDILVLQKFEDSIRSNYNYAILLRQCKLYIAIGIPLISGMGLTPTEAPTRSPKERVIASPGTLSC